MRCPQCYTLNVEGVRYCRDCGYDLGAGQGAPAGGGGVPVPGGHPAGGHHGGHGGGDAGRTGPPWEQKQAGFDFAALLETIKGVLFAPTETFDTMRREGGLGNPLGFAMIMLVFASFFAAMWQGLLQGAMMSSMSSIQNQMGAYGQQLPPGLSMLMGGGSFIVSFITGFILSVVLLFLIAGLVHLALMILGGANQPFETTLRVYCYTNGAAGVLQAVPGCGPMVGGIWGMVVTMIGLARAHETDTWKGVVAVLLPMVVCCVVCGGATFFVMTMGMAAGMGSIP